MTHQEMGGTCSRPHSLSTTIPQRNQYVLAHAFMLHPPNRPATCTCTCTHTLVTCHLQGAFPTEAKEAAERTLQQKKKEEDAKMKHLNHTQKRQAMGTARTLSADRKPPFPPLALFSLLSKTCSTATI